MATLKNNIFTGSVRLFEKALRLLGPRAYWKTVPRIIEELDAVYEHRSRHGGIYFYCPGEIARRLAETLLTREPETIEWIDGFDDGDTLLDIGANMGCYSIYAAKTKNAKVIAIEPAPQNVYLLSRNIILNGLDDNIFPICAGLSDHTGLDRMNMSEAGLKMGGTRNSIGDNVSQSMVRYEPVVREWTMIYGLDNLIATFGLPKPNHLKLDIDLIQDKVIAGAGETLRNANLKSAMLELNPKMDGTPYVLETMEKLGFRLVKTVRHDNFFVRD